MESIPEVFGIVKETEVVIQLQSMIPLPNGRRFGIGLDGNRIVLASTLIDVSDWDAIAAEVARLRSIDIASKVEQIKSSIKAMD